VNPVRFDVFVDNGRWILYVASNRLGSNQPIQLHFSVGYSRPRAIDLAGHFEELRGDFEHIFGGAW
jgi:hypothetical protein